jgi:hypothetical protein
MKAWPRCGLLLLLNPHAAFDHSGKNGFDLSSAINCQSDVGVTCSAQQENGSLAVTREQKLERFMQNLPAGNLVAG